MSTLLQALHHAGQPLLDRLEEIYKDFHRHPELSMQEVRTADILAGKMRALGYEVTTRVGVTGVVCVLRNGAGATVMLRADLDALRGDNKSAWVLNWNRPPKRSQRD